MQKPSLRFASRCVTATRTEVQQRPVAAPERTGGPGFFTLHHRAQVEDRARSPKVKDRVTRSFRHARPTERGEAANKQVPVVEEPLPCAAGMTTKRIRLPKPQTNLSRSLGTSSLVSGAHPSPFRPLRAWNK